MLLHLQFTPRPISLFKKSIKLLLLPVWLGLWFFAGGLLVWYLLRWWPGDRLLPVRMLNYFTPWLLLGLLPGLGAALLARRYRLALALALPTLLVSLTYAPLFLPKSAAVLAANTPFKVMSYNIWGRNNELDEITSLIKQEQPDILLLQEVYRSTGHALTRALADLYPDTPAYFVHEPDMGQLIISRYPLTPVEASYQKGRLQKVEAHTPAGVVAVWNVHPHQPLGWRKQRQQITALANDIAAIETPLIVGGDFNTTEQAESYRLINQYLANAHWEAGWGFGFSFPAHRPRYQHIPIITPMVRIDHIFYSEHFYAHSAKTLRNSGGSDHFPVIANLSRVD